jgi:carbamoyl-phosphate synthase large subunit
MNVQYAIKDGDIYVLEVNPRAVAHRCPFVAKVIGLRWPRSRPVMAGETCKPQSEPEFEHVGVKEAVFPLPLPGVDTVLGPEMKSTGEVMGSTVVRSPSPRARSAAAPPAARGTVFVSCATTTSRAFSKRSSCWTSSGSSDRHGGTHAS